MKNILVLYYTQTGQLKQLTDAIIKPLQNDNDYIIDVQSIIPEHNFPFPWSNKEFFEVFPETYKEIPFPVKPLDINENTKYDLIILAWQPWFLSPSLPISSFLQTNQAKQIFNNTPVVTVSACRNMWIMGFEKLRQRLHSLNAHIAGNISLVDPHPNLISVLTVIGWLIHGKKEKYLGVLPAAGVSENEIKDSEKFGHLISDALKSGDLGSLNAIFISQKSVEIKPELMLLEIRGHKLFGYWAEYIRKKGDFQSPARRQRVKAFSYYLPIGIFLLSPIVSVLTKVLMVFNKSKVKGLTNYYLGIKKAV